MEERERFRAETARVKELLAEIRARAARVDPSGNAWEMRATLAYRVLLISDRPRFEERPVDIVAVAAELEAVRAFIDAWGTASSTPREVRDQDPRAILDRTAFLYGLAWDLLQEKTYLDAAELFSRRFRANGIELELFRGAECFDLGCGISRNCKAMADLGAARVVGLDLSELNICRGRERLAQFEVARKIELHQGDLFNFFDADAKERFDFICCQGVLHHLEQPERAVALIARLLRPAGRAFVYVFGDQGKGAFWDFIDLIRALLVPVPIRFTRDYLSLMGIPDTKSYAVLDFGYVPCQVRFVAHEFEMMLEKAGLSIIKKLDQGEIYDQNRRSVLYPADAVFYGDYDLRYLLGRDAS